MYDLLGAVGDVLAAPRRGLWGMAGAPFGLSLEDTESGHALLSRLGMDPESPWTHALGLGAEILGDPLTWGGGLIARSLLKAPALAAGANIDDAVRMHQAAQAAEGGYAAQKAGVMAQGADEFDKFRQFIDPDSLMRGDISKGYARVEPGFGARLEEMGLGSMTPEGGFTMRAGFKPEFTKEGVPWMGTHEMAGGARVAQPKGNPPSFAKVNPGRSKYTLSQDPNVPMPESFPSPGEMGTLRRELVRAQQSVPEGYGHLPLASIHNPVNPQEIFRQVGAGRAAQSLPAPPSIGSLPELPPLVQNLAQARQREELLRQLIAAGGVGAVGGIGYGAGSYAFGGQ